MAVDYVVAVHGGAGTIAPGDATQQRSYHEGLRAATVAAEQVLREGGSAMDAVVAAVVCLEDCPLFNAGLGAAFNGDGLHELDAAVMDGQTLAAGAVACVTTIRNPVLAAREVMQQGRAVVLAGDGALRMAQQAGLALVAPDYFSTPARRAQWLDVQRRNAQAVALDHDAAGGSHRFGTVGAVARDRHGRLAAATSTGGVTNKQPGRVGDTPIVGAGVYANDVSCAVSCTGTGEHFIRTCLAHDIHARIHYGHQDVDAAASQAVQQSLKAIGGRGGAIVIGRDGQIAMPFNSTGMYRAWVREREPIRTAIFSDAH